MLFKLLWIISGLGSIIIINMINNLISNNSEMCLSHCNIPKASQFVLGLCLINTAVSSYLELYHLLFASDFMTLLFFLGSLFRKYINSLINRDRNHRYRCFVLLDFCIWFCSIKKMKKDWCVLYFQDHDNEYPNTVYNSLHPSSLWRDIEISWYYQGLHHCHNFSQLPKDTQIARFFALIISLDLRCLPLTRLR